MQRTGVANPQAAPATPRVSLSVCVRGEEALPTRVSIGAQQRQCKVCPVSVTIA
jgi:hypothetical protein